jgi:hypothetical protein
MCSSVSPSRLTPAQKITGSLHARRKRAESIYFLKKDAIARAKCLAKAASRGQVKVHGRNGRIQVEYTYKEDPVRTRS